MASKARVTIDIRGTSRKVFSIGEDQTGDLRVVLQPAEGFRHYGDPAISHPIRFQKYSVHPSEQSQHPINVIKHTLILDGADPVITWHRTRAMKESDQFAPLFLKRFPDLSIPRYDLKKSKAEVISIGDYWPDVFMMFQGVFVSNRDRKFAMPVDRDTLRTEWIGRKFRLIALTTFAMLKSDETGDLSHVASVEKDGRPVEHGTYGSDEEGCIGLFKANVARLLQDYLRMRTKGTDDQIAQMMHNITVHPIGRLFSNQEGVAAAWADHLKMHGN